MAQKSRQISIPGAELAFIQLARQMLPYWKGAALQLIWTDAIRFKQELHEYQNLVIQSNIFHDKFKETTETLRNLDKEINRKTEFLKKYIKSVDEENYQELLVHFGIVKQAGMYKLPMKRSERLLSLKILVKKIVQFSFKNFEYGYAYWLDMFSEYAQAVNDYNLIEQQISDFSVLKKELRTSMDAQLRAYAKLIDSQYPITGVCRLVIMGLIK